MISQLWNTTVIEYHDCWVITVIGYYTYIRMQSIFFLSE